MGIDYYACRCGDTFPDCGPHESCECGQLWCDGHCAEADGYRDEENGYTPKGSRYEQATSCNYCRDEHYSDDCLLDFALTKLDMTRENLIEEYKKNKEGV